jgi:hypothetical protein
MVIVRRYEVMGYLLSFLLIALAGILARRLVPFIFRMAGWPAGNTLVLEERVGAMLLLLCSVVMAGIAYWYPWYLSTYHSAPDDRYGFAILLALPFWFVGAGLSAIALFRLLRAVVRGQRDIANWVLAICGALLALGGFSPLVMLAWRLFSR